ncbi:BA14K family protein [Rhizobium sp. LjRoot98]|uniref:BA14K family protein n=1 Tax=Rhizobium sp. Root1204 TaxID=1736428 RepID=UPI0009EAD51D|nr:BA14K family protein [Rhizobium sp. Root1204]
MNISALRVAPLALSAIMFATSFGPVHAFVAPQQPHIGLPALDVETVQHRRGHHDDIRRHGFHRRGDAAYYNGHRGYHERRRGYREYNGMWFPLAAFATGAIIGGVVVDRPVRYGGSHVEWCGNRYRSYRAYDNTYQPNYGPRRQCHSPY